MLRSRWIIRISMLASLLLADLPWCPNPRLRFEHRSSAREGADRVRSHIPAGRDLRGQVLSRSICTVRWYAHRGRSEEE